MNASPLRLLAPALLIASLNGCMSMSGLGGKSEYACQAPEGVACDSMSGVYANAIHNNLPSQRPRAGKAPPATAATAQARPQPVAAVSATAPLATSLRSSPRILRLWFKPWEDADHDLYDQGYVYVQIDNGQWLIEHAQRSIRADFAPVRPPPASTSPPPESGTPVPPREPAPYPPIDLPPSEGESR